MSQHHNTGQNLKVLIALLLILCLTGCAKRTEGGETDTGKGFVTWYLNTQGDALSAVRVRDIREVTVDTALELLSEAPGSRSDAAGVQVLLGNITKVKDYSLSHGRLTLDFTTDYSNLTGPLEVLFRASVVQTLCQVPEVELVLFTVGGAPLMDSNEKEVGLMGRDTFIENTGTEFNSYEKTTLTLYFANEKGTDLRKVETVEIHNTNIPLERLVMQELIKGPEQPGVFPTLPPETKLNSISVKDKICYVSLDSLASDSPSNVSEEVELFSVVNSLTELPGINRVQLSINGDSDRMLRQNMDLSVIYEKNTELIEDSE
ncbi:MAG: GerMN domain-containing protein [Lachnospiraceae bacterium]|nr:GerMN domain-containing protein [Lachnospiraceae bacterium]